MRELSWMGNESENEAADISSSKYLTLRSSLKEVCSFDDLKQRMRIYLSMGSCKEIFNVMTQVVKVRFCKFIIFFLFSLLFSVGMVVLLASDITSDSVNVL